MLTWLPPSHLLAFRPDPQPDAPERTVCVGQLIDDGDDGVTYHTATVIGWAVNAVEARRAVEEAIA